MFFRKNYIFLIIIILLIILLAYTTNITSIPESLILFQSQEVDLKTIAGIKIEETVPIGVNLNDSLSVSSNILKDEQVVENNIKKYNLSFLGFNVKTITANILKNVKVVPGGDLAGLKLYTNGVLVVGTSEIKGEDDKLYKPFENTGIEQGDKIVKINGQDVNTTGELISCVSKSGGKDIQITYIKGDITLETKVTPIKASKNMYKIGLWVRDSAAGVGTVTFYEANTQSFAALGHGIQDVDTERLVDISTGEVVTADILNIEKGRENIPGKIEGTIEDGKTFGTIYNNTEYGIYGKITKEKNLNRDEELEVALRNQIKVGKAKIICTLGDNKKEEYEVEIEKIYKNNSKDNKSMVIKVIDEKLLEKTGGIIQGMSGSPIIQNGKLVGALTHVFVSDPTKRIWRIC